MKKIISLLLVAVLACAFVGCSNRNKYSEEAISAAEATIMYSEQYFDGTITAEEAYNHIQSVNDELYEYHYSTESENSDTHWNDSNICVTLSSITIMYINEKSFGGNISEIKREINALKKEVGYK